MIETIETVMLAPNKRARIVADEHYETRGSYALDTDEETREAEGHELDMLQRGIWTVVGVITEDRCSACGHWAGAESLWGIVVPVESMARDALKCAGIELPDDGSAER